MCGKEDVRNRVNELMEDSRYTQQELCNLIEQAYGEKVYTAQVTKYRDGSLDTPKARRVLLWMLELLIAELRKRERLYEQSLKLGN